MDRAPDGTLKASVSCESIAVPEYQPSADRSATDDGLPGSGLTYAWSKVSGPGSIASANPNAKDTVANFSMTGSYVLRLTVSDGELSASEDVSITVTAADPAKILNAINAGGPGY